MPEVDSAVIIQVPSATTWEFIKEIRNWAELIPGYQAMTELNQTHSVWTIRGDVGILARLVTLDVNVEEWRDLEHVTFAFSCREEPLVGRGLVRVDANSAASSRLTFRLSATAGGMLGPVVNALLAKVLPSTAASFASELKSRIESAQKASVSSE